MAIEEVQDLEFGGNPAATQKKAPQHGSAGRLREDSE
jgi:hypothetical protein